MKIKLKSRGDLEWADLVDKVDLSMLAISQTSLTHFLEAREEVCMDASLINSV